MVAAICTRRHIQIVALLFLAANCAHPQGIITTVAGNDFSFPSTPLPALSAPLGSITSVALDSRGNLYIADPDNNLIFKMDTFGVLAVVAGNGIAGYSGDGGPATSAALRSPGCVAVDSLGNVYICDNFYLVRKVTPKGIITTVAGNGKIGFSGDGGPATSASFSALSGLAVDAVGNLFISDGPNQRIRKVTPEGVITTVAGNGKTGFSGDGGPATAATLYNPAGIAVDAAGNLFIADFLNNRVRKVTTDGIITTVAGGPPIEAGLVSPGGIAVDSAGNLFISNIFYILKVTPGGGISTFAGNLTQGFSGDGGPATSAALNQPSAVATDVAGNVFIADTQNRRLRKVDPKGIISTVAGNGNFRFSGDGGNAIGASLNQPQGVAVDAAGDLLIADKNNHRTRKVTSDGTITTVAGNGTCCYSGDHGPATSAALDQPWDVAEYAGSIFISDNGNFSVRKITPQGTITTVAASSTAGTGADSHG